MGPAAGVNGGHVVAEGTPAEVAANPKSLTGDYLSGRRQIPVPPMRRPVQKDRVLQVVGARGNNLKNIAAGFPLGTFTCVTGVSGGGKSTLVVDTLYKAAARRLMGAGAGAGAARPDRGAGPTRQDHRHRPVADRPHAALQPGDLHRSVRADPRLVRRTAGSAGARLQARPVQLQRQGRALRGLPGRRPAEDRDALPAGRLCHLRHLQGQALQPRNAGNQVPRQVDRRGAGDDGGRSGAVFQRADAHPRPAEDPAAGRPRLYRARPAGDDAVGRRGAADQAVEGTGAAGDRADAVYPGRADHRACISRMCANCWKCCTRWSTRATPSW